MLSPRASRLLALQQRSTRNLNSAALRALAPRTPNAVELRYLKLVRAYMAHVEALVREQVLPLADERDNVRTDTDDFGDVFDRINRELGGVDLAPQLRIIGREVVKHADKEVSRSLGIDLRGQSQTLDRQVEVFVRANVALIKSVPAEQLERMREIISSHHATQTDRITLRNKLMDTFGLSRARANLIARDQVLKANAEIVQFRQQNAGVTEYRWVTSNDERVRGKPGGKWPGGEDHWSLDGKVFRWDDPPVVDQRTGRRAHPGQSFQCRCVPVPVVDKLLRG